MGRPLLLILLALYTNLDEAQAKLDATAAARTGGGTPNLPDPVRKVYRSLTKYRRIGVYTLYKTTS